MAPDSDPSARRVWLSMTMAAVAVTLVACSSPSSSPAQSQQSGDSVSAVPTLLLPITDASTSTAPPSIPATTTSAAPVISDAPELTAPPATTVASTTSLEPTTTVPPAPTTPYAVPLTDVATAGWGPGHSGYPATDIFASCGHGVASPVNGVVTEVRTVDSWDPNVDNPATRGGRSITIVGDDDVRYYHAHLDEIDGGLAPQQRVVVGQRLGTVGITGRTSACHLHFGISPPCSGKEWSVRRGAIPPHGYLDDWRRGDQTSPATEVALWSLDNPDACALAMTDPFARDS